MIISPHVPLRRGMFNDFLRWLVPSRAGVRSARRSLVAASQGGDIRLWRGFLHSDREALRALDLRLIGVPEDEVDAELCLVKGEVLLRADRRWDAQRFFRQAPHLASNRRSASAVTLRAAAQDFEFQRLVEEADRARDASQWEEAAALYREGLQAYPDHYGYLVQLAHCLKEREQFAAAECHYRSALALGAPQSDVHEHLIFVAAQQGFPASFDHNYKTVDGDTLNAPPSEADVKLVVFLLLGREPTVTEILQLLRRHHSIRTLVMEIVGEDSLVLANARLLSTAKHATPPG
jgi:tetratricopeptide (TPR) repeat protein